MWAMATLWRVSHGVSLAGHLKLKNLIVFLIIIRFLLIQLLSVSDIIKKDLSLTVRNFWNKWS